MNGEIDRSKLPICLENHEYQDWWVEVGLMTRLPFSDDSYIQLTPDKRFGAGTLRTLGVLSKEIPWGYLIGDLNLAQRVLPNFNPVRDLPKLGRRMEKVQNAIVDKKLLFRGYNIGWAMFVEQLKLSAAGLILMYPLYLKKGECVTVDELAEFGYPPNTPNYAHKIWDHIDELRQKSLPGTTAQIETPGLYHQISGYRLVG